MSTTTGTRSEYSPSKTKAQGTFSQKRFKPELLIPYPPLPSVKEFNLENLLANELKEEADEVISSLLKVASNYQTDLRLCIRDKLSIEQKIQYKNIRIVKLIHSINSLLSQRSKKLNKFTSRKNGSGTESNMESEISSLLEHAGKASLSIKSLINKIEKLDEKFNKDEESARNPSSRIASDYPYLMKFINYGDKVDLQKQNIKNHSQSNQKKESNKLKDPIQDEIQSIDQTLDAASESTEPTKNEPNKSSDLNRLMANEVIEEGSEDTDIENFELFMSKSIRKYRQKQQLKRYDDFDFCDNANIDDSSSNVTPKKKDTIVEVNPFYHKPENPISLLYASLTSPLISDSDLPPSSLQNRLGIKSSPTVRSTFQTSHFKKLRISGSPITSATFRNMKELPICECEDSHQHHRTAAINALSKSLSIGSEEDHCEEEEMYESYDSTIDDEQDVGIETVLSSESSDSDSSSLESSSKIMNNSTTQYYLSLNLKRKAKNLNIKKMNLESKKKQKQVILKKVDSPTPKHKPSHHILKPKNSILKISNSSQGILGNRMLKEVHECHVQQENPSSTIKLNDGSLFKHSPKFVDANSQLDDKSVTGTIIPICKTLQAESSDSSGGYLETSIDPTSLSSISKSKAESSQKSIKKLRNLLD